jgi:LPXTG-motif cell wall-anchored protein
VITTPPGLPGGGVPDDPAVETTAPPAATTAPPGATATPPGATVTPPAVTGTPPAEATSAPVDAITDAPIQTTVPPAPPAQGEPPAAGSGGGGLAKTGSNVALPVSLGVVLVAAGLSGVLFARRRKRFVA